MAVVTYLIVGGGGGGGSTGAGARGAGGGGAGGFVSGTFTSAIGSYAVTVGTGGAGASSGSNTNGSDGNSSSIAGLGLTTALGGGHGSHAGSGAGNGGNGGSGGGAGDAAGATQTGGTGQGGAIGNSGGNNSSSTSAGGTGAGGGGSAGVGTNATSGSGGTKAGGAGTSSSISGAAVTYCKGGNGGATNAQTNGSNGTNPGDGGGGGSDNGAGGFASGGNGSNGIVIISYVTGAIVAAGGTITTSGGNTIHTFTTNGTFIIAGPPPDGVFNHDWPNPVRKKFAGWRTDHRLQTNLSIVAPPAAPVDGALRILINGVDKTTNVEFDSVMIRDVLNQPSTATFNCINGYQPINGQSVVIYRGTITIMAGYITTNRQVYLLKPNAANLKWPTTAIDRTYMLRKRCPFENYVAISATNVIKDLIMKYAPLFRTEGVQNGLPAITVSFNGLQDVAQCITAACNLVGAGWSTGDDFNVNVSTQASALSVRNITDSDGYTLNDPGIEITNDLSQVRNRVFVKGIASQLVSDVAIGETIIPLETAASFNSTGGSALIEPSNTITYTSIQLGGGGSVVGPGVTPLTAPTLALTSGAGVDTGAHQYAVVYRTTNDASLSLPSPIASITTGSVSSPSTAPVGVLAAAGAVNAGAHLYAITFVDGAGGETTPGSSVSITTWAISAPTEVVSVATAATWSASGFGPGTNTLIALTLNASLYTGETTVGNTTAYVTQALGGGTATVNITLPSSAQTVPTGYLFYHAYVSNDGGANYYYLGSGFQGGTLNNIILGVGSPNAPTSNNLAQREVDLSSIPVGPSGIAQRKIYRTVAGGSQLKLLATLADNTTTVYNDTTADASLGANAPSSNTTALNWVVVGSIPIGPTGTTQRWVYRSVAGGTALFLAFKVADNITTSATDTATDASLGAAAPSSDTSGLTQPAGTIGPGSSSIIIAGLGSNFPSTGGWAIIGNGDQKVRYTGTSGNNITGIPASGIGSIVAAINYGSTITAAPAITGCTGVLAAIKGTQCRLFAQRDNVTAQVALALIEGSDGIHEHTIDDNSLLNNTAVLAAGDAELNLFSSQVVTVKYSTRDMLTHSGKNVAISLINPPITANLVVQDVTITGLWMTGIGPLYAVTASTTKFTLQDLLAQIASINVTSGNQ